MKRYNRSSRRSRMLELMRGMEYHPTAYEVFEKMRGAYPSISLGTVYRNLNVLTERGEIRKLDYVGEFDRFDPRLDDHDHFLCTNCDRLLDVDLDVGASIKKSVRSIGHEPKGLKLEIFGICKDCTTESDG